MKYFISIGFSFVLEFKSLVRGKGMLS